VGTRRLELKIFRNPDVMWREEDEYKQKAMDGLKKGEDVGEIGTSILYSGGEMLSLNMLGTEIWKRCDGKTIDELVTELLEIFEVEPEVLKTDAIAFMDELKEKGYLEYGE
jgi:GeoRSP system PqqD family protein